MAQHLVIGAGGIGRATARSLVARGHTVRMGTRHGTDPGIDGVTAIALNAADVEALSPAATGADSIVNAVNPASYTTWERDWPPMARAILAAAEHTGATLVTVSNLYGYGPVSSPMTESTPLRPHGIKGRVRAEMWRAAREAHEAGRIRATELRASDYFGPGARKRMSFVQDFIIRPTLAGRRTLRVPMGNPDVAHSWTYLPDIGELAATLATDERAWGHPWHVPTAPPRTMTEVATEVAEATGVPVPSVRVIPPLVMAWARVVPLIRALDETRHQFEHPFLLDATAATDTFGLIATPWEAALDQTLADVG
ncbi:MAG: NAD(P)H-binding protein [Austwickia sp.]|jgi:nucleoside-diphosphate-sugar epimerase|nr:NAD(P)H-binding protein [Austwickia sp.]MBK8435891.1 NAD(P)H-binding protein [Austwickia sp.]MBK9101577.1 NAD(P)H-binding protein [Austwickia sp.]